MREKTVAASAAGLAFAPPAALSARRSAVFFGVFCFVLFT
jgi:hypothetical protein